MSENETTVHRGIKIETIRPDMFIVRTGELISRYPSLEAAKSDIDESLMTYDHNKRIYVDTGRSW